MRLAALKAGIALAMAAACSLPVQAQDRLAVEQAHQALARGAVAWDLRTEGAVLPGAVRLSQQDLQAWLEQGDTSALSRAVSAAGLNLSAEVVLVADDDATAQAVAERVRPLTRGRLAWLAGGTAAWQAAGLPLDAAPTLRLPMPQRLTPATPVLNDTSLTVAPADAARRMTVTTGVGLPTLTATTAIAAALR